jgi:hypothetical protein
MRRLTSSILALACVAVGGAAARRALAKGDELGNVDSVLDRLEKRLLDQEADGLSFDEKNAPPPAAEPTGATTKYRFDGKGKGSAARVTATTDEREQMGALSNAVKDLENQVDQLAANVQKTKQSILDEASIDNFVDIQAELSETDTASIKTLNIKLDGYPVYELHEASGLWLPSKGVPLYAGPLQPGAHRLDLEARIVVRHKDGMPMNADVYRFVNKTFEMSIPGGTKKSRYTITIKPPVKVEDQADAVMKEGA